MSCGPLGESVGDCLVFFTLSQENASSKRCDLKGFQLCTYHPIRWQGLTFSQCFVPLRNPWGLGGQRMIRVKYEEEEIQYWGLTCFSHSLPLAQLGKVIRQGGARQGIF